MNLQQKIVCLQISNKWPIQTEKNLKEASAWSANAGAALVVVCAVLARRGEPGAATINSLHEERHSSARGAPSDRRQNR